MALAAPARRKPAPGADAPALGAVIARRFAELAAVLLALAGVLVLVSLLSYDANDPSLNTATLQKSRNLAGPIGAGIADLLLQGFGAAGVLPGLCLLAWSWRLGAHRVLSSFPVRLAALLAALPAFGAALSGVAMLTGRSLAWPTGAGPGGAGGGLLAEAAINAGRDLLGPFGGLLMWSLVAIFAVLLAILALGLTHGEWRAAGRAARATAWAGHRGAGFLGRLSARLTVLGVGLLHRLNGTKPPRSAVPEEVPAARMEPRVNLPDAAVVTPRIAPAHKKLAAIPRQESLPLEGAWRFPPLSLLAVPPNAAADAPTVESVQKTARQLEGVLADYGVQGQIVEIRPGPVVTLYELEPAPGIRSARVIGLADDIARSLCVTAVRIATVPGRNVIGIEVPNARRSTVYLSELLATDDWDRQQSKLAIALGKDISGKPIIADLAKMPHLLVAGTTGSGKSVGINAMILSLLYRLSPDQCRLILIDPKMLELSVYEGIPHLMAPVVTEPGKAVVALKWTVKEMERRYRAMSQLSVRNIGGYNERVAEARGKGEVVTRRVQTGFDSETGKPVYEEQPLALEPLPFIVVIIDEMADLMMVAGKEIEITVQRLAQMARAAGIHVVMATQRPSVDVITGTIKANFPTRISFQVISKFDSRTILGEQGSEQLLGMGDMLYMSGGGRIVRVHGPFVSDREVEEIVAFLREQGEPAYVEEVTEAPAQDDDGMPFTGIAGAPDGEKDLFDLAVDVVSREGKASTSFIQRQLKVGYNKAANLIEQMEKEGIVGPANHVGKREVLVRRTGDDDD